MTVESGEQCPSSRLSIGGLDGYGIESSVSYICIENVGWIMSLTRSLIVWSGSL